jgi:hypothetical protein
MADITLSSRTVIRPYRSRAGSPRIQAIPVASTKASTAAIAPGQVVQFDGTSTSNHKIIRCSSNAALNGLLPVTVAGVAAQADPNDGSVDPKISVWTADGDTEFIFPTKVATASSLVGTAMSLAYDSSLAINFLMASTGAGEMVWVTEVPNAGDTNGFVVGKFQSSRVSNAVWVK